MRTEQNSFRTQEHQKNKNKIIITVLAIGLISTFLVLNIQNRTRTPEEQKEQEEQNMQEQLSLFQDNITSSFSTPMVMAMVQTSNGYESHILNFSFSMFRQGSWDPLEVKSGNQIMLFALDSNMAPIHNGEVKLTPPMTGFSSENMGGMQMMMYSQMFSSDNNSSMWRMMMFNQDSEMNMTIWKLMQNNGVLPINDQGYAVISPPDMPGLWRGTVDTPLGEQGFFFRVSSSGSDESSDSGSGIDFEIVSPPFNKNNYETVQVVDGGGSIVDGTVSVYSGNVKIGEGVGGSCKFETSSDKVRVELSKNGSVVDETVLYTESYSVGGSSSSGGNIYYPIIVLVIVFAGLYLFFRNKDKVKKILGSGSDLDDVNI